MKRMLGLITGDLIRLRHCRNQRIAQRPERKMYTGVRPRCGDEVRIVSRTQARAHHAGHSAGRQAGDRKAAPMPQALPCRPIVRPETPACSQAEVEGLRRFRR